MSEPREQVEHFFHHEFGRLGNRNSWKGTRYIATALHSPEEAPKMPAAMGMHQAWEKALDQLVEPVKSAMKT